MKITQQRPRFLSVILSDPETNAAKTILSQGYDATFFRPRSLIDRMGRNTMCWFEAMP